MTMPLRHSHVAVRGSISSLARAAKKVLSEGEDDFGRYRFFDLMISPRHGEPQRVRFAAHEGDRMVHVLAEDIENTTDLARALSRVGIRKQEELSISTNQDDQPLRDARELFDRIQTVSKPSVLLPTKVNEPGLKRVKIVRKGNLPKFVHRRNYKFRNKVIILDENQTKRYVPRDSTILPRDVGSILVFMRVGKILRFKIDKNMVGRKFGEFAQRGAANRIRSERAVEADSGKR